MAPGSPELLGADKDVHSRGGKAPTILTLIRLADILSIDKDFPREGKSIHGRRKGPLKHLSLISAGGEVLASLPLGADGILIVEMESTTSNRFNTTR